MNGKPMSRDARRLWMKGHVNEHAEFVENPAEPGSSEAEAGAVAEGDGENEEPLIGGSAGLVPEEHRADVVETGEEAEELGLGRSPSTAAKKAYVQSMITLPAVTEKPDSDTFQVFTHKGTKLSFKRKEPSAEKESPDPLTDKARPVEERTWAVARRFGNAKNAKQAWEAAEAILEALEDGEATKKVTLEEEDREYVFFTSGPCTMRFSKERYAEKMKDFKERLAFKGKKGEPDSMEAAKVVHEECLGELRVWLQNSMKKDRRALMNGLEWDGAYTAIFKHFMRKLDPDHDNGPSFAAPAHSWLRTAYAEEQPTAPEDSGGEA